MQKYLARGLLTHKEIYRCFFCDLKFTTFHKRIYCSSLCKSRAAKLRRISKFDNFDEYKKYQKNYQKKRYKEIKKVVRKYNKKI